MEQSDIPAFWPTMKRGILGRCPNCGKGKLFKGYLKQVDQCSECGENLGQIRADDGPAWLTVLLTGHLVAPFLIFVIPKITLPDWELFAITSVVILSLIFAILPRAKGFFISLIWRLGCLGANK